MKRLQAWGLLALFLLGLLLWLTGPLDIFREHHLLSVCVLLVGGLLVSSTGLVLLGTPASGIIRYGRDEVLSFSGAFGIGLAAIGFAISPGTTWPWPGLLFVAGGISLLAWAPQALGRGLD